jgi:hypothetical protein
MHFFQGYVMERRINHRKEEVDGRYNTIMLQLRAPNTDTLPSGVQNTLYNSPVKQLTLPNILPRVVRIWSTCERTYGAPYVVLVINDNSYGLMVALSY